LQSFFNKNINGAGMQQIEGFSVLVIYKKFILLLLFLSCHLIAQPTFNQSFTPNIIGPNTISKLTYTITNGSGIPVTDLAFTNTLPAGMTIATPSSDFSRKGISNIPRNVYSECINGIVIAEDGGSVITLSEGRLSAFETCTITVNVTGVVAPTYNNVSGDLTSSAGNSGTSFDSLDILGNRLGFSKSFNPSTVAFGDRSRLIYTIVSTGSTVFNATFTDKLPKGLILASPTNETTDCIGTLSTNPDTQIISFFSGFFNNSPPCTISLDVLTLERGVLNSTSDLFNSSVGLSGFAGDSITVEGGDDFLLTQRFVNNPALAGDTVELEFTIFSINREVDITNINFANNIDATLSGLVATGLPMNDVCGVGSQISGTSTLSLSGATLTPEQKCVFSVTIQVPSGAATNAYPNIIGNVTGLVSGIPTNASASTDSLIVNTAPQLTKTFLNNPIGSGQTSTMEFTITNPSTTSTLQNISFQDEHQKFLSGSEVTLPANNFCNGSGTSFDFLQNGQKITQIDIPLLAPATSCTFNIDLLIPIDAPLGDYTNSTSLISAIVDGTTQFGLAASANLTVVEGPDVSKEFLSDMASPGDTVELVYTLSHEVFTNADATGINFTDNLSTVLPGLAIVGPPMNDVCGIGSQITGTNILNFTGGTLSPGATCTFSVTLQVPVASIPGSYLSSSSNLTATVTGQTTVSSGADDTLGVTGLTFSKEFIDDPTIAGDTVTMRFTIDNTSPTEDATGMVYTDNLNAALSGLSSTSGPLNDVCGTGSQISGTTFLIFTGGNLTAGTSCTFDLILQVSPASSNGIYLSPTSSLTATIGGSVAVIDPASDALNINNTILALDKSFTDDPVMPGGTVTLEFNLTNLDAGNAVTGISFTDDLDAALTGLVATGLPAANVCGAGSTLSGTNLLTLSGGNLPASGNCSFSVTLQVPLATATGAYTNTTSSVSGTTGGLAVSGDAASDDLNVSFVEFSKSFANPVNTGSSTTLNFTINNTSANAVNALSFTDDLDAVLLGLVASGLPLTDVCGVGSQISGTSFLTFTGGSLNPGTSCSFSMTVTIPTGLTTNTYLNTTSDLINAGLPIAAPATAELMVNGLPQITISPLSINFGNIEVGNSSSSQSIVIGNIGTEILNVTALDIANSPFANTATGSCGAVPFNIAMGSSCNLSYNYSPSTAGLVNQTIQLTSDDAFAGPSSFSLSGNGIQAELVLTPKPLDIGDVLLNTTGTASVTLLNNGTANLNVTAISMPVAPYTQSGGTCVTSPFTLTPASSCTIEYSLTPTVLGIVNQSVQITSNAPSSIDTLNLTGNGTQGSINLTPSDLDFGDVILTNSSIVSLVVLNDGDGELTISAITAAASPFSQAGGTCGVLPITIQAGSSCTIEYRFDALTFGVSDQLMQMTSNASNSPTSFNLMGNAIFSPIPVNVLNNYLVFLLLIFIIGITFRKNIYLRMKL
jgi:uncharacterized repeat protein (TIGR01451 family)